jgi:hypothetical protein
MRTRLLRSLGAALLLISCSGCSVAIGAATGLVLIGVGALTSGCYDHVEVGVRDARGVPLCDAEVIAVQGDDEVELTPCFSTALSAGNWQIQARYGQATAVSQLSIPEERECGRTVYRIELTLAAAQAPTRSLTANPIRSSGTTSSTTPISTAALGMP